MPIRDKVYEKLKSIGLTDSKEDFFNYYDNNENVRKQAYNKLRDAGLTDSEEDFYEYMKPQQTMAQQARSEQSEPYTHVYDANKNLVGGTAYESPEPYQYKPEVQQRILQNKPDMFKPKTVDMYGSHAKDKSEMDLLNEGRLYELKEARQNYLQRPITEFGEAFEQGTNALYQGAKNLAGETANLLGGSQRDYKRAQSQLDELVQSGYDLKDFDAQKALKDYQDRDFQRRMSEWEGEISKRRGEREDMNIFESLIHKIQDPERPKSQYEKKGLFSSEGMLADEMQLSHSYHAIQEALKQSNGDVEEAYKLLGEKASKETWGDEATREARKALLEQRETKGFGAWVGGMIPQMIGTGAGVAMSFTPWGQVARLLGAANMAALTGSTAGMSMAEARNYAEEKGLSIKEGDIWKTGAVDAAIELGTEYIPFNRYFNKIGKNTNSVISNTVSNAVKNDNNVKREFGDLLDKAAKDFKLNYFSKENIKEYLTDVAAEGLSEFTAEALQTLSPIIYQNPEDYPSLMQVIENGWEGAKGGLFMGAFLGAGSGAAQTYRNRVRREKQGGVVLANTKNNGVVEILGEDKDGIYVAQADGKDAVINADEVIEQRKYTLDEFNQAANEKFESDIQDAVESENAIIDSVTDPSTGKYAEVDRWIVDEEGERVAQHGYIVGWIGESPIFLPEGMENIEENRVALKPAEWNPESLEEMDNERVKAINEEMIRTEAAEQAEMESKYAPEVLNAQMQQGVPFNTPTSQIVPVSPMPEGNGWIVEEHPIDTNNKVAKQPIVRELTNDEFRDMLQAQLEAQEAVQAQIAAENASNVDQSEPGSEGVVEEISTQNEGETMPGTEEVRHDVEGVTIQPTEEVVTGNNLSPIEEVAQPQAEVQPQAPVIPTKKDGSIDFVTYGKDNSFKELGNLYGEKMPHKVEVTAKALAEDVIKAQQAVEKAQLALDNAPIGRDSKQKQALEKAQNELAEVQKEASFWNEMNADIKKAQAERESMLNPQAEVNMSEEPMDASEFVAQQLANGNVVLTSESFKKETGYGETERKKFMRIIRKAENGGMTVEQAAEKLVSLDNEGNGNFFGNDTQAARDAIIDVLSSAQTWGDISNYIKNNRKAQAAKESEGLREELEEMVAQNYHTTLEDYVLQNEAAEVDNPFDGFDIATKDAIFAEAEEEYQRYLKEQENGQTEGNIAEGSGSVLSEEQADNTGRIKERQEQGDGISQRPIQESEGSHDGQQEVTAEENRRIPLRNRANEWAKALGVKVTFIENIEDVDTRTRAQIEASHAKGDAVPGWVARNGEVFFFMPDLQNINDVNDTYVHEVVAHVGLPKLLGKEKFGELCDKVWEMMPTAERVKYMNYPGVKNHRDAADEYIAFLAEQQNLTPEQKSVWDYIVEFVRDALDKALNGIIGKSQITNDDIAKLIKISYTNLKSGKAEGASVEGERFNAKKVSDRRQEKNRMNNTIDQAVALVMGQDVKEAKADRLKIEQKRKEDAAEIYESVLSGDFNDVTLQKINDYIDDSTPLNPFGRRIFQRLPQKLERKLLEGARTNIVDALFSRISESAVPSSRRASEEGRREIEERKKEALKGWAIATNNWYTDLSAFTDETEPFGEGTDSKVYAAKEDGYVIKTSFGKPMGKRFRPDIDTVVLFNRVFPNSPYEIVGYGEFDGKFARILKQPAIDFAEVAPLTIEERVEYMRSLGFEPINEAKTAFSNGEIIAADIQKSNIVKDAEGNVTVIDADMKLHTKDVGGNYTYPPVEADLPENPHFRVVEDKNGRKSLVGLHNISEEKLKKAIKQGGLANPSMAVIDMDKQAHVDYGDITLVAPAELIDKNTGRSAGTYMGDAWTPVYPKVTLQLDNKGWKKINQYIESIVEDRELQNNMKYGAEMYMEGGNGMYMNFAFLKAKGLKPEIFYKNNDGYISTDDIKKLLGVEEIDTSFEEYSKLKELPEENLEELKLWARTYGNKAKIDSHKKRLEEIKNQYGEDSKVYKLMTKPSDELGYGEFDRLVVETKRKERDNGKIDSNKTFNEANYYVAQNGLRQEFENWMDELLLDAGAKEVFFAGYTPSGNKRYMANTIENVSKFMNKQSKTNAYDETGFGATKALFLKKLNTLEEIREQKGKLVELEEYRETTQELSDRMGDLISRLSDMQTISSNKFMNYDYAASRLQEAMTKRNPIKYLNDEYGYGLDKKGSFAEDLSELINDIKDSPARYFETKFERPVYLNEFAAAVVPQGTSKDVVNALTEAGLPVEEYERGNNEGRMAAVDKVASETDGVRFRFIGAKGAANLDKAEEATTRLDNLNVAREMEAANKDAKTIKMATGWERGADVLWRYEVPDNLNFDYYANVDYKKRHPELARFDDLRNKLNSSLLMGTEALTEEEQKEYDALEKEFGGYKEYHRSRKLKDYIDAPELFDAYPELRNVELLFMEMEKETLGRYLPSEKAIVLNSSMKLSGRGFIEQVLVHEIQHAIQHIEGFEQGANKNMQDPNKVAQKAHNREFMQIQLDKHIAERDELLKQNDALNDKMSAWYDSHEEDAEFDDEMNEYDRQYDEIESQLEIADRKVAWDEKWLDATKKAKTELGEEGYAKVAGEVEARNVTSRMKMSDFDRRNTLASETEDVAREDQIFLKDGIESGMRFRLSEKGKQIQEEVDKFTSKYASKPVVVMEKAMSDNEKIEAFDNLVKLEEINKWIAKAKAAYVRDNGKIYIFADNVESKDVEQSLFHENIHANIEDFADFRDKLWERMKDIPSERIEHIKSKYKEDKWPEEFLAYTIALAQQEGYLGEVAPHLDEAELNELIRLLNKYGYDYAKEYDERRRTSSSKENGEGRSEDGGRVRTTGNNDKGISGESEQEERISPRERAERLKGLFDKVADMGLEGVLGNGHYNKAMMDIYRELPEEARKIVADDALSSKGIDFIKAMDRFLNEKAEPSIWEKVTSVIREWLRKAGFNLELTPNEVKYIWWRSQKPLDRNNVIEVAEDTYKKYQLKVGEFEDSPNPDGDGGGTRFSVKPKTKAELKNEVRDLKEDVKDLKDEVRELKKQVKSLRSGSKEEWERQQRAITSFIQGRLTKEAGESLGKTRIEQLLRLVNNASTASDLRKPLQFIEQVINSATIDNIAEKMDKLIKTKLQGETNRGVAKGVVVDESTRRLFDSIRGTFKDMISTSIDSELRSVRGEILRFGKEINALPEDDIQGRTILKSRQDALKSRREELEKEQEELQRQNIIETKETLKNRYDELVDAMDAHINGEGIWTQEMQDEYDSIPLREKLADICESQDAIDKIMADAVTTRRNAYLSKGSTRQQLLVEANMLEDNLVIAQEELISLMKEVSQELSEIIKEGKSRLSKRKQALAERRQAIVGMGIAAVKDKKIQPLNANLTKKEKFEKWMDNSFLKTVSDFMTAPLNSFNFMLKYIDRNHTIGEGKLYNHFMKSSEGALEANNQLYDGLKSYNSAIEEKAKEIFGKDIESVMKDSGKEHKNKVHKQYMYDSATYKEGEMYPITITKGQALYVWLVWRQDDGHGKLLADGWNDQSIKEIEDLIGEDYMKFGEWITDDFFPELREKKYNKTHIEMFGTSMAKREHYFPFKVSSSDIQEKGEMGESYSGMPSTITGNIIKRTINKSKIDTEKNAFDMIYKYGNDMETWNAMAKLRQDLNFLHASKAFRNYLEANGKGLFDKFMKSAEVAVKAYNNGEADAINDLFAKINRMWAGSNIGFRLNTAMKQILSYPAFTAYSGNLKYQGYLAKYMMNWVGNYKWALENLPAFRNRVESGDMGMTGMTDPTFDLGKAINKLGEWGMVPNQLVDALTCAAGARSVYDFEFERAKKAGLSEEEAMNVARYNAEIAFNETQQSSRAEFVSPTQVSRNVLIKSMMNYQNSNVGYQRMGNEGLLEIIRAKHVYEQDIKNGMSETEAKKKLANSVMRGTRKAVVAFTILPGLWYLGGRGIVGITAPLISSLFGGGGDDEPYLDDEAKEGLLLSILLGTIAGTSGGQAIASVVQGREYEPMAYVKEFSKVVADAFKDGYNMNTTKNIALKLAKFGGVNVETFENIYLGVEHAIKTGNFDLVDFMFLINLPASQRKEMAKELYSDMPFMEYAEKMARAQKLFDDYRKSLPYSKEKTKGKETSIKKDYVIEQLDSHKQDALENEKEFRKLKREYNEAENKEEWLKEHPEYKEIEKEYGKQLVTKEVNKEVKKLK